MRMNPKNFSLIELLVVTAILSILMSLLLPVLAEAKAIGKRTLCLSNLKQQGSAYLSYTIENDDWFPKYGPASYNDMLDIFGVGGKVGSYAPGIPLIPTVGAPDRLLNPYVGWNGLTTTSTSGMLEIFRDPADNGTMIPSLGFYLDKTEYWDSVGQAYYPNTDALLFLSTLGLTNRRFKESKFPDYITLSACSPSWSWFGGGGLNIRQYWHSDSQDGLCNMLFIDGHAVFTRVSGGGNWREGDDFSYIYNAAP